MTAVYPTFQHAQQVLQSKFLRAPEVHPQRWQGVDVSNRPEAKMVELLHESFRVPMISDRPIDYTNIPQLNLPWCDDHFEERICGYPINPGIEWANWPWGTSAADHLEKNGQFNHNYMERYWPKHAGHTLSSSRTPEEFIASHNELQDEFELGKKPHLGIRYEYGDLNDLVQHLALEPDTRQAYLPIFYPEDTGTMNPTRKPCTLGYHFILRHGYFHVTYYMRSCDFYRHWADDCYLTVRLHLWILSKLREMDPDTWRDVKLGLFVMHITSLHMFTNDLRALRAK